MNEWINTYSCPLITIDTIRNFPITNRTYILSFFRYLRIFIFIENIYKIARNTTSKRLIVQFKNLSRATSRDVEKSISRWHHQDSHSSMPDNPSLYLVTQFICEAGPRE